MSNYKPLFSSIWTDHDFQDLSSDKKLVLIYLLTNQFVEKSGIYKISVRQINFDTGVINEVINEVIDYLIDTKKIKYDHTKGIIFVKNIYKFHKGLIKNQNILLLTLRRNYNLVNTSFWNDFFEIYKEDKTIKILIDGSIDGSLMAHQLYNSNSNSNSNSKNRDKEKGIVREKEKEKKEEGKKLEERFGEAYSLFNSEKRILKIPFDKHKSKFEEAEQELSKLNITLLSQIQNYLEYLKIAHWRKKAAFEVFINTNGEKQLIFNDWLADIESERRKSMSAADIEWNNSIK